MGDDLGLVAYLRIEVICAAALMVIGVLHAKITNMKSRSSIEDIVVTV